MIIKTMQNKFENKYNAFFHYQHGDNEQIKAGFGKFSFE